MLPYHLSTPAGKLMCSGVAGGPTPASAPPRPSALLSAPIRWSTVDLSRAAGPQRHGPSPWGFFHWRKIQKFDKSYESYTEPPELVVYFTAVPRAFVKFTAGPSVSKK
jgi:hypothetical protein